MIKKEKKLLIDSDECPKDENVIIKFECQNCKFRDKFSRNGNLEYVTCRYLYEDIIETIEKFIIDREKMLQDVNDRISIYKNRLSTAQGDYKDYCEKILIEEEKLYKDIEGPLNNAKSLISGLL